MKPKSTLRHFLCIAGSSVLAISSATAATLYWDGADTNANANGGAGTWDNGSTSNWDTAATGGSNSVWTNANNDTAVFGATAGTVTLGGGITVGGLQFDTASYLITGNTLTFGTAGTILANADATISSALAGNVQINKTGTGMLTLKTASTRNAAGVTVIDAGILRLEQAAAFGAATAPITIYSSGTLEVATTTAVANGTGTISLNNGGSISKWPFCCGCKHTKNDFGRKLRVRCSHIRQRCKFRQRPDYQ